MAPNIFEELFEGEQPPTDVLEQVIYANDSKIESPPMKPDEELTLSCSELEQKGGKWSHFKPYTPKMALEFWCRHHKWNISEHFLPNAKCHTMNECGIVTVTVTLMKDGSMVYKETSVDQSKGLASRQAHLKVLQKIFGTTMKWQAFITETQNMIE